LETSAIRERRRAQKRKEKQRSWLLWGSVIAAVLALAGFLVWRSVRPAAGEAVPIMANAAEHVPDGADPGPFNTDPPTSGRHYGQPMEAGFYAVGDPETQTAYPEGYLLHSLEHGYVIFWYNCDELEEPDCSVLKDQIKTVMEDMGSTKLIGFPRASIEYPLVMTSWGQMQPFETFDETLARKFVSANRNRAPEPNAP
jgi:hypothetical protein